MSCSYPDFEIRNLADKFPTETLHIINNAVNIWQQRQAVRGNTAASESVPSYEEMKDFLEHLRSNPVTEFKAPSKEALNALLDGTELPEGLVTIATNLGIDIKVNRRTRQITLSSFDSNADNLNFFKALAVDLFYQNAEAEDLFDMSPRERLDAIFHWRSKNRGTNNFSAFAKDSRIATIRLHEEYNLTITSTQESMYRKAAEDFNTRERMDRASEIVEFFSEKLTEMMQGRLDEMNERQETLRRYIRENDKQDFLTLEQAVDSYTKELGDLQAKISSYDRKAALADIGVNAVLNEVLKKYSEPLEIENDTDFAERVAEEFSTDSHPLYVDVVEDNVAWYRDQMQKVVDNFSVLCEYAASDLQITELVQIHGRELESEDFDRPENEEEAEGREEQDNDGFANQFKENWMFEFDTVSNWSKLSVRLRNMMYKCPLATGKYTRFNKQRYTPVMEIMSTLLEELQGCRNSLEMDERLDELKSDYAWIPYIQEQLAADSQLKTEFFHSTHRAKQVYGVLSRAKGSEDTSSNLLKLINLGTNKSYLYADVQNQLLSGVPLVRDLSLYDDEAIKRKNIAKLKDILDKYMPDAEDRWSGSDNELVKATPDDIFIVVDDNYPDIFKDVTTVLRALGFSITENELEVVAATDVPGKLKPANNLLYTTIGRAYELLSYLESKPDLQTVDDVINEFQQRSKTALKAYSSLADVLTVYDNGTVEPSTRENGKVRYSYTNPSSLDDFMQQAMGVARFKDGESLIDRYIDDPRYVKKGDIVNEEPHYSQSYIKLSDDPDTELPRYQLVEYRNPLLAAVMKGLSFDYFNLLNSAVGKRNKVEQKNWSRKDRADIMWALYHQADCENIHASAKRRWLPIALPSDSGRQVFIAGPLYIGDRKEIIKEYIIKELERMTDQYGIAKYLSDNYRNNMSIFCSFPVLNNDELREIPMDKILSAFEDSIRKRDTSELDTILDTLANAVLKSMHEKFREENPEFCEAKNREFAEDAETVLNEYIEIQGIHQLAFNELFNGDAAFYEAKEMYKGDASSKTTYIDEQKRAKQVVTPIDHIDIYNPDFLESYKRNRGIPQAQELAPDEITQRILYIDDPGVQSSAYEELVRMYDVALKNGIIDANQYKAFIEGIRDIKHTDGQGFSSFESTMQIMYGLGEIKKGDEVDRAYRRIAAGQQQPGDGEIVRAAFKPFESGLVPVENEDGSVKMLMPFQHKLSTQLLTAALVQAQGTMVSESPALRALNQLMRETNADTVMFVSCVKTGNNGSLKFNVNPETATEAEILADLRAGMKKYQDEIGRSIVHEIPWSYYGLVSYVPDEGLDSETNIGTQLQKLITQDLPDVVKKPDGTIEKAQYIVNGEVYDRDGIRLLYNQLMTEKIRRKYEQMTGKFADIATLSRMLQDACRRSSRDSSLLRRAFSLDENGNFVIPLCDLSTINLSSEFLNSIVRNDVVKMKSSGKAYVSMSVFGLHEKLKINLKYDEDGNPVGYESMDCLLPAWSKSIIDKCSDERGILDFSKLEKEDPRLLRMIGVRIPTQFKNFILPLRCVGFLPTILGDTIVTAADTVVLQDADFDVDKIYVQLPAIDAQYRKGNWRKLLEEDYREYFERYYDTDEMYRVWINTKKTMEEAGEDAESYGFGEFIDRHISNPEFSARYRQPDAPEGEPMERSKWKAIHKNDPEYFIPDGPALNYHGYTSDISVEEMSDNALDNGIIEVMQAMLTSTAVATQSLASGSPSAVDGIVQELRNLRSRSSYIDGPGDFSTRISQEVRNSAGKEMIAVLANATSIHALLQTTKVSLNPMYAVTINGRKLTSLHDTFVDGNSVEYISRLIGTLLGAAADNAKDPRLDTLNLNLVTAPVVSILLQLGYDIRTIAMFLNIPSIRHYTDANKRDQDGYLGSDNERATKRTLPDGIERMIEAIRFGDDYESMDDSMRDYCDSALAMFKYLEDLGKLFRTMSTLARGDSGGTAPHGGIENNLARALQYEMFLEDNQTGTPSQIFFDVDDLIHTDFDGIISHKKIINSPNPIAQAYVNYGVAGAFKELAKYYPGLEDPAFRGTIKKILRNYYNGEATARNVKTILFPLYRYLMTRYDVMNADGLNSEESRAYYMNEFPEEAQLILAKYPYIASSLFFRRLSIFSVTDAKNSNGENVSNPFISLAYEGRMLPKVRDEFTLLWQQLFYERNEDGTLNDELRGLAMDLYKYGFHRNGGVFTSGSYSHLAPVEARTLLPGYSDIFPSLTKNVGQDVYDNFELQFLRNNLRDRYQCCNYVKRGDGQKPYIENGQILETFKMKPFSKLDSVHQGHLSKYYKDDGSFLPAFRTFTINSEGESVPLYFIKVSENEFTGEATYIRTTPLGWGTLANEYDANTDAASMNSVYDQSDAEKANRKYTGSRRGKNKKANYHKDDAVEAAYVPESSEEGNSASDSDSDWTIDSLADALGISKADAKKRLFGKKPTKKSSNKAAAKTSKKKEEPKQVVKKKSEAARYKISTSDKATTVGQLENEIAKRYNTYTISLSASTSPRVRSDSWNTVSLEYGTAASQVASALAKKLSRKNGKKINLFFTGSYSTELSSAATQEEMNKQVSMVLEALKKRKIFVDKLITTAQPGIPLAAALEAEKRNYAVEVVATSDYKILNPNTGKFVSDKEAFMQNLGWKHMDAESKEKNRVYDAVDPVPENESGEYVFETDPSDVLSGADITKTQHNQSDSKVCNLHVWNTKTLKEHDDITLLSESGKPISGTIFFVTPKGKQTILSDFWRQGKFYAEDGSRILDDIKMQVGDEKSLSVLTARRSNIQIFAYAAQFPSLVAIKTLPETTPLNTLGLTWLDDNDEPLCK